MNLAEIPSPCYVIEERLLRKNLEQIRYVKNEAGVNIILAFKGFALWKSFPILNEYGFNEATASSLNEAKLAYEEMGAPAHTYSVVYDEAEFNEIMNYSSFITFNSIAQFDKYIPLITDGAKDISVGLRINPEFSQVSTDLYNPCSPGSRLGVVRSSLPDELPRAIQGLHVHALCESSSFDLEKLLHSIKSKFHTHLLQVKWLNLGGGHLMTRKDYNLEHLIQVLKAFRQEYPHLQLILEPGSAFAWETGFLVSRIMDITNNSGIKTAILDVSFTAHMPDCLEMPYKPKIRNAYHEAVVGKPTYRMGGNSCLSGDFIGDWSFDSDLNIGDHIIFEDMIHYTMVKTSYFNGVKHPSIGMIKLNNEFNLFRSFTYLDYKNKLS